MQTNSTTSQRKDLVVVALGSNLGDSRAILHRALANLRNLAKDAFLASSLWATSPVDCPPGSPAFCNAVAAFVPSPTETPWTLLSKLQALERDYGRLPKQVHNEARPLDLDLIQFGDETLHTPQLALPHPRAHLRLFVLAPLAEILPSWVLPGQTRTVSQLARSLKTTEIVQRLDKSLQ